MVLSLGALLNEAKSLGLKVFLVKIKIQVFVGLMDDSIQTACACGKDIEIWKDFTYLNEAVKNNGEFCHKVFRLAGLACDIMNSLYTSICMAL